MLQPFIHYFLHFGFPLIIALVFFRKEWKKVYLILLLTMVIDLDHLLANPIFQPNRCSINFHPLHTYYAFGVYVLMLFFKKPYNITGLGLILHLITDLIDCLFMYNACRSCLNDSNALELLRGLSNFMGN